jgi:RNA polymerase sigma factor (sigma-70 family)
MRHKLIKTKAAHRTASAVRNLNPTAQMPIASVVERFSQNERETLQRLLAEPLECIYHPCFRSRQIPGGDDMDAVPDCQSRPSARAARPGRAGGSDVLSGEQEQTLFLRFNYCRYRVMRILANHRSKRLTAAAARELLKWEHLWKEARTHIVRCNTALVLAMARRSRNNGVELGELVSEGNLALLRCVDKFDASRGFKFSTYACRAILASFSRAGAKAARYRTQFPATYDPAMDRGDHLEQLRDEIENDCVDELKRILFENSADLNAVEKRVLKARFSLGRKRPSVVAKRKTLDQVGDLLGVSKERVRQIQNQAMLKIRAVLEERLLAAS